MGEGDTQLTLIHAQSSPEHSYYQSSLQTQGWLHIEPLKAVQINTQCIYYLLALIGAHKRYCNAKAQQCALTYSDSAYLAATGIRELPPLIRI